MSNRFIKNFLKLGNLIHFSLPTFASESLMSTGINGITATPTAAYRVIGLTSRLGNGFTFIGSSSIVLTFNEAVAVYALTYIRGGVTGSTYNGGLSNLQGSNDGTNWATLFTGDGNAAGTDYSYSTIANTTKYSKYKFNIECPSSVGASTCAVGAINLYYDKTL